MSTDLYVRLLAEIDRWQIPATHHAALRAVVELHAPAPYFDHTPDWLVCHGCDLDGYDAEHPPWPCSTIQAIAEQLGVPIDKSITEKEERRD